MTHVKLRRLALAAASFSISTLIILILIGVSLDCCMSQVSAQGMLLDQNQNYDTQKQSMPISISFTPLLIQELASYDGQFAEDGTEREVQDVAAIMLYNCQDTVVPYAYISVYTHNCRYTFRGYMIPPKSKVLIPEEHGQTLTETQILSAYGWTTVSNKNQQNRIDIEEIGMNCLHVTNRSGAKVNNLTLYHKTYIPEGDFYMCGVAFKTEIAYIGPGESVLVYPSNYAAGYSKVVYCE